MNVSAASHSRERAPVTVIRDPSAMPSSLADLLRHNSVIVDPIPIGERKRHPFLRAMCLGAMAYNLGQYGVVNTVSDGESETHFFDGNSRYPDALAFARSLACNLNTCERQFPADAHQQFIDTMSAREKPHNITSPVIFGLDPRLSQELYLRPSDRGAGLGVVYDGDITPNMLDKHTQKLLENLSLG